MSQHPYTLSSMAFVRRLREKVGTAPATWFDVSAAYDAGMYHALEARQSAKRSFAELQARKEVLGFTTQNKGNES